MKTIRATKAEFGRLLFPRSRVEVLDADARQCPHERVPGRQAQDRGRRWGAGPLVLAEISREAGPHGRADSQQGRGQSRRENHGAASPVNSTRLRVHHGAIPHWGIQNRPFPFVLNSRCPPCKQKMLDRVHLCASVDKNQRNRFKMSRGRSPPQRRRLERCRADVRE
jgi:hypothetical protein